jgi:hypothetical protein
MDSTRGLGGVVGAIVWILINDVAGGIAGLAAGSAAMTTVEPVLGAWAATVLLVSVPVGLCAGALLGMASLGWVARSTFAESRRSLSRTCA